MHKGGKMNKLRLFALRKADELFHIPSVYFSTQKMAKQERDAYTARTGEIHVVCPGPDHKRYKEETCAL